MKRAWTTDGRIILDGGSVILCDDCPCDPREPSETGTGTGTGTSPEDFDHYWWCVDTDQPSLAWFCMESYGVRRCLLLTVAEKDALVATGAVVVSGPHVSELECIEECVGTGTGPETGTGSYDDPHYFWWCVLSPNNSYHCLELTLAGVAFYESQGWEVIGGPYASQAICLAACDTQAGDPWYCVEAPTVDTGTGTGVDGTGTGTSGIDGTPGDSCDEATIALTGVILGPFFHISGTDHWFGFLDLEPGIYRAIVDVQSGDDFELNAYAGACSQLTHKFNIEVLAPGSDCNFGVFPAGDAILAISGGEFTYTLRFEEGPCDL